MHDNLNINICTKKMENICVFVETCRYKKLKFKIYTKKINVKDNNVY